MVIKSELEVPYVLSNETEFYFGLTTQLDVVTDVNLYNGVLYINSTQIIAKKSSPRTIHKTEPDILYSPRRQNISCISYGRVKFITVRFT